MRIVHFADLHLGVETYGKSLTESGLPSRMEDFLKSLDDLVDFAIDNNVDAVIFSGDLYKKQNPSMTQQREFAKRVKRLTEKGIPLNLLMGNHDLSNNTKSASSGDIFKTLAIPHVYVMTKAELIVMDTKSGPLQVVGMPWIQRANVMTRKDNKNLSIEELNGEISRIVSKRTAELASKVDTTLPCIFTGHLWAAGSTTGTEENKLTLGSDPVIQISTIALPEFDYVALGHIHRMQVLRESDPPVIYPGSLESIDFGDAGQDKGFYVVDINKAEHKVEYRFIQSNGRKFIKKEISVDIDDLNPTQTVLAHLQRRENELKDNIVRLTINIDNEIEKLLDDQAIKSYCDSLAYHFELIKERSRMTRNKVRVNFQSNATPEKILETYLNENSQNYTDERRKKLFEYGSQIIQEALQKEDE
ncbi:MAG: exonuclease SbcCD subunit D [Dehalococcoidales bacterium]|nr:exonuclease SbcCD subunit D [Dehalococcoidales bacterium]